MVEPLSSALLCISLNVYFEARNQPEEGQLAVAYVTLNRSKKSGKSVCNTVVEPKQFSWATGRFLKDNGFWLRADSFPVELDAWIKARRIARMAMARLSPDPTHGATHYHERRLHPVWATRMQKVVIIAQHVFYKPRSA
jgi:spore germination cell wall hydrolase CwlJ-like protein